MAFYPRLTVGIELEYAAIVTNTHKFHIKAFYDANDYERLYERLLAFIAETIRALFADVFKKSSVVPQVMAVPVLGHVADQRPDIDQHIFWICKKESPLHVDASALHTKTLPLGVEITSPPLRDVDEGSRADWTLAIQTVIGALDTLRSQSDDPAAPLTKMESDFFTTNDLARLVRPSAEDEGDLRFHLIAPDSAGVHVHIGVGDIGTELESHVVKNVALLSWFYDESINTFHLSHRGVDGKNPAIRSLSDLPILEGFESLPDPFTRQSFLDSLYDLPLTKFVDKLTAGQKTWKVFIRTKYSTVEFRQLAATFQAEYVVAWVEFVAEFVRKAHALSKEDVLTMVTSDSSLEDYMGPDACTRLQQLVNFEMLERD